MGNWDYGLLAPQPCISDWKLCLFAYCLPVLPVGLAAEKTMSSGDGVRCISIAGLPFISICFLCCWRRAIREAKGVDGNIFFDCLATYCCPCCSIFQAAHEAGVDGPDECDKMIAIIKNAGNVDVKGEANKAKSQGQDLKGQIERA